MLNTLMHEAKRQGVAMPSPERYHKVSGTFKLNSDSGVFLACHQFDPPTPTPHPPKKQQKNNNNNNETEPALETL